MTRGPQGSTLFLCRTRARSREGERGRERERERGVCVYLSSYQCSLSLSYAGEFWDGEGLSIRGNASLVQRPPHDPRFLSNNFQSVYQSIIELYACTHTYTHMHTHRHQTETITFFKRTDWCGGDWGGLAQC